MVGKGLLDVVKERVGFLLEAGKEWGGQVPAHRELPRLELALNQQAWQGIMKMRPGQREERREGWLPPGSIHYSQTIKVRVGRIRRQKDTIMKSGASGSQRWMMIEWAENRETEPERR